MIAAKTYIDIYTNMGFLFYSVAAADGNIHAAEVEELKRLVKEKWLPLEGSQDKFGTDAAHYISMSFDYATANDLSADEAFSSFVDAYKENEKRFDRELKKLVLDTASAISDAFGHRNKAEQTKLAQIQQLFRH